MKTNQPCKKRSNCHTMNPQHFLDSHVIIHTTARFTLRPGHREHSLASLTHINTVDTKDTKHHRQSGLDALAGSSKELPYVPTTAGSSGYRQTDRQGKREKKMTCNRAQGCIIVIKAFTVYISHGGKSSTKKCIYVFLPFKKFN